jgi:hypothetical protein
MEMTCSSETLVRNLLSIFWKKEAVYITEKLELKYHTELWKLGAVLSSETLVLTDQTTLCHNTEQNATLHRCENLQI